MADNLELGTWNALCSTCGVEKPISEYHKHPGSKTGYRPQCKQCKNAVAAKWRNNNKISIATRMKVYSRNNREKLNAHVRNWRKNNLEYDAKRAREYRMIKANQKPLWANDAYILLWYKLAKIEEKRTGRKVHVDHIIPLRGKKVCGLHCEDNMQLLFSEENSRKGNRYG